MTTITTRPNSSHLEVTAHAWLGGTETADVAEGAVLDALTFKPSLGQNQCDLPHGNLHIDCECSEAGDPTTRELHRIIANIVTELVERLAPDGNCDARLHHSLMRLAALLI
ncbi:hypothetical protein [Ilumatobacter sp.]|uniref:hypothetical protein n=1 Tax=Ilumatobacter sp. TaxID=1967498 RepID=UPI0037508E41